MNTAKKINVNYSSLVGLKAELLRKQAEVSEAKAKTETAQSVPKSKLKNKRPKEDGKIEHVTQELTDVDDIKAHKKSKLMLEAKARLYEQLKKSKHNNESFLVDFTTKSDESEEEHFKEEDYDDSFSDPEDSWVEYEDCFGRTRKCLRKDLPLMQKKDDVVKQQIMKHKEEADNDKHENKPKFVPQEKEPEIEIMRRKWEEQTQKLSEKVDIHYQDILFDEARAHGVGYYAFSQDEEERTKQQQNLANLRKQTEQKQKEMKELKEMRDQMEKNRLKAARIRRRIRAGLPAEPTEEEIAKENIESNAKENICNTTDEKDDSMDKNHPENSESPEDEKKNKAKEELVTIENKIKAFGELLGKKTEWREMSQEEWVDKCREKRIKEFGPVYDNFHRTGYLEGTKSDNSRRISTEDDDTECQSKDTELHKTDVKTVSIQENDRNRTCISPEKDQDDTDDDDVDGIIGPLPPIEFSSTEKSHSQNTTGISNLSSDRAQNLSHMSLLSSHTTPVRQLPTLSTTVPSIGVPPPLRSPPGVPPPSLPPSGVPLISILPSTVPPPLMPVPSIPPSPVPPPSMAIPPPLMPVPSVPPSPVPPPLMAIPPPSSVLGYHDPSNTYPYSNQLQTTDNVQSHKYFYAESFSNPSPMMYMYPPYPLPHTSINTVVPPNTISNTETVPSTNTSNSDESSSVNTELNTSESIHVMKEEDIAAGLKYLREKFEKRQIS